MDIWYDEYKRENTNQASKFKKKTINSIINLLTSPMVFSFCEERALLFILMKVLQHNQSSHSYTAELRNFHDRTTLEIFR